MTELGGTQTEEARADGGAIPQDGVLTNPSRGIAVELVSGRSVWVARGQPDAAATLIATHQHGRISRSQLLRAGWSPQRIRSATRAGRLIRVRRGVYAVGHLAQIPGAEVAEALLAVHATALVDVSVLAFHRLAPSPADTHVNAATSRRRPGIQVHDYSLTPADIRIIDGLPMTTVERALLDSVPRLSDRQLERALDEALYRRLTSRAKLTEIVNRNPGHNGRHRLGALLDPARKPSRTESTPQERALQLIRQANLQEQPETEVELWGFRADFFFRQAKVVLEIDSFGAHGQIRRNFARDRRKDRIFRQHGLTVARVTDDQLRNEPLAVVAELSATIATNLRSAA